MTWQPQDLAAIDSGDEIRVAPNHKDGRPGEPVIVWAVRVGNELFARSARGPQGGWYRRALASGVGHITANGRTVEVAFVDAADAADHTAIDAAYHAKYDRYGQRIVGAVVGDQSHAVTIRIDPA